MTKLIEKANLLSPYENTVLMDYREYARRHDNSVAFADLSQCASGGIPLASYRDEQKQLHAIFAGETHSLILGSTRSGKTTGFVIPLVMLKARQKDKDSLLITDPKGELYVQCASTLRENGYRVILLNFRDYRNSEYWNPLTPIFRKYQKAFSLEHSVVVKESNGYCAKFMGETYRSAKALREAIDREKQLILYDVDNDIDSLALQTITTEDKRDPYWEDSARQLLVAFIYALLEDSVPETAGDRPLVTEDTFSFRTIMQIYGGFHFSPKGFSEDNGDDGFFGNRDKESRARAYANSSIMANGGTTRLCILSMFNAKMAPYKEVYTNLITSCNSFEMDELADEKRPVAVFVVYRDEARTSYYAVQSFITCAYTKLIEIANKQPDLRLQRPFLFLLDEFGNLPRIPDFDTTISACGGRNIWFQIVLQSYAQLDNNYGKETAQIIKENLNMHIFFGTNNAETKKQFSGECGRKTIISPSCVFLGDQERVDKVEFQEVAVVPVSRLNSLKTGECYITISNFEAVLHSHYERSYLCPEFAGERARIRDYKCDLNIFDKKYIYSTSKETNPGKRSRFDW